MCSSYLQTVTGNAYCSYQPLLFSLDGGIDCPTRTERDVPLDRIDKVMQLPQVHIIDAHAFQRTMQFLFRLFRRAHPGLSCQKELLPVLLQPGRNTDFGIAIASCYVNMIDAILQ